MGTHRSRASVGGTSPAGPLHCPAQSRQEALLLLSLCLDAGIDPEALGGIARSPWQEFEQVPELVVIACVGAAMLHRAFQAQ